MGFLTQQGSFDVRKNALNTLKILAAFQVAYLHMLNHLQVTVPEALTQIMCLFMGVPIFFMLSGFLIWNSIHNASTASDGSFLAYAKKRATRIFPELWVAVAVEIIVLLIMFKEKINWLMMALFTVGQATVFQFWTPDFLRSYGCGTPNGSLWTMGLTIQFYIAVWFLYKWLKNKNGFWWTGVLAAAALIKAVSPVIKGLLPGVIGKLYGQTLLPHLWLFMLGAFLAHYQHKAIPFLKRTWWLFFAASFVFSVTKLDIGVEQYGLFTYWLRVPALIGLAYNLPSLNIKFDISYGLFIYHMTVVNIMIELGLVGHQVYLVIALLISTILALLSTLLGRYIAKAIHNKTVRR